MADRAKTLASRATALALAVGMTRMAFGFDVVEATIPELLAAYSSHEVTATQIVQQYLARINKYDTGEYGINSVALINPDVFKEAAAIDQAIANGVSIGPLMGVPVLVKDSYDVAGLPTTNGVGALHVEGPGATTNLIATSDSFAVAQLRAAGAIILGKANMSTMAYSYNGYDDAAGRVLNPYVPTRTPGGSSSGSGAAVAANLTMFAMGGETGGSIRVPSTNNADVGLKTSAGLIDPGGTWPLTPTRDVVGPIAKTVTDVAYAMDAMVAPSSTNLWNNTPFYPTSAPGTTVNSPTTGQPVAVTGTTFRDALSDTALQGKVLAVPKAYIGQGKWVYSGLGTAPAASSTSYPYVDNPIDAQVLKAFNNAIDVLKAQGATIVYVDIPAYDLYSSTVGSRLNGGRGATEGFPYAYPTTTVTINGTPTTVPATTWSSYAAAYYYEKTIESYHDPNIKNLRDLANAVAASPTLGTNPTMSDWFDPLKATASAPTDSGLRSDLTGAVSSLRSLATIWEQGNALGFENNPDAIKALQAFADLRKDYYTKFMKDPGAFDDPSTTADDFLSGIDHIDSFVLPTLSYLSTLQKNILVPGDAVDPTNPLGISYLSLNARTEANILGVPGLTVPMGYSEEGIPMGLEFMGDFLDDAKLLGFGYDYEQATLWRMAPNLDAIAGILQASVPEPASLGLLSVGGLLLVGRRRKRRA